MSVLTFRDGVALLATAPVGDHLQEVFNVIRIPPAADDGQQVANIRHA